MEAGSASATRSAIHRADVVGPLLRPPWLIRARNALGAGARSLDGFDVFHLAFADERPHSIWS